MENEKNTLNDLAAAVAKQSGVKMGQVRPFLSSLGTFLADAVVKEGVVKISGLGTFKLQQVEPRKSVDVNTGEAIVIGGYTKVAFTPEPGVKTRIANPGEGSPLPSSVGGETRETGTPETDPIAKLGQQADEIMGLVANINNAPSAPSTPSVPSAPSVPTTPTTPTTPSAPTPPVTPPKKDFSWLKAALTIVGIFLLLFIIIWFVLMHKIDQWMNRYFQDKQQPKVEQVAKPQPQPQPEPAPIEEDTVVLDSTEILREAQDDKTAQEEVSPAKIDFNAPRTYKHFKATVTVQPGESLADLSRKFYGSRIFWPYIYEANQSQFPNPDDIPVGSKIRIPKMDKGYTDYYSKEARDYAKVLEQKLIRQKYMTE